MALYKAPERWEYGDFQTPESLARDCLSIVSKLKFKPQLIIEPTCGKGEFLLQSEKVFPQSRIFGLDINPNHLETLKSRISSKNAEIVCSDFFTYSWENLIENSEHPILIIGNPPWVTSSELSILGSKNLPEKSNFQFMRGIEALTGKSNFDISEWMLLQHVKWLENKPGVIAMLCKTSVARKVLRYCWQNDLDLTKASIYKIDPLKHFNASVDACFLILDKRAKDYKSTDCHVYHSIDSENHSHILGYHDDRVISNLEDYTKWQELLTGEQNYKWRSGIKHDCSRVMELRKDGIYYLDRNDERISLENEYIYPLLKSSDIKNGCTSYRKHVIVTQKYLGEDTSVIADKAPATWKYLIDNADRLDSRKSSIYRNKPRFSIFGIGEYSFSHWKVAISGFYKSLDFRVISPDNDKPVMVDDTVYFLSCSSQEEAQFLMEILNYCESKAALSSLIFWQNKRPITADILHKLNLRALSKYLNREEEYSFYTNNTFDKKQTELIF